MSGHRTPLPLRWRLYGRLGMRESYPLETIHGSSTTLISIHQTTDQRRHSQATSRGPSHVVIGSRLVPQEHHWIYNGTLVDAGLATPIIGNNTTIVIDISVPDAEDQGTTQIPIGEGAINTSTGPFPFSSRLRRISPQFTRCKSASSSTGDPMR